MKHTHRTHQVRDDHELAALHVIILFNGQDPTPGEIDDFEYRYRGIPAFESALRRAADKLREIAPDFKAEEHPCLGQLCDQDGQFDVSIVEKSEKAGGGQEQP